MSKAGKKKDAPFQLTAEPQPRAKQRKSAAARPGAAAARLPRLDKLIDRYYADLADLAHQNVMYEMGTRTAFFALLAAHGRQHGWTLIAEHSRKVNGRTIRPDGTFKDTLNLVRGHWEAKDTSDDLDVEIRKKIQDGYPTGNIIFEDTQTAVLYQNGREILRISMRDPLKLAELLTEFFRYTEPQIEEFEHAVDEFKQRVPDLAQGLAQKIAEAHRTNPRFKAAFAGFFELCKSSLNPTLSQAAVDEMLIQHILTERLIREIFDNPEFVRRNVIAAEVEKVMQAMTSSSFDRNTYLKELDRFYVAIERAARTMTDFADKQHFLNTIYERFFQGYSIKLADTMGIVYTPQEIVDFMCASVAEVLDKEFGKKLWSDDVYLIDPCTGTGNFIVNLIRRIPKARLEAVYRHRLFANEIMLLPYYIAALNIEHAYFEQTGVYEPFEGLCFVDTLDLAEHAQGQLGFMTAKNSERVSRQKNTPITVVIGNPPWNVGQEDENQNNKNRPYPTVDGRIRETFVEPSKASLHTKLYDAYVRFYRWAMDRLGDRDGIVCFVSNNGFLHGIGFDGFRRDLAKTFGLLYHFDFKGNARTSGDRRRREGGNIFSDQIRAGVGITVLVRAKSARHSGVYYHAVADQWDAELKRDYLAKHSAVSALTWERVELDNVGDWQLGTVNVDESALPIGSKDARAKVKGAHAIFTEYSLGASTNRDAIVYDFSRSSLEGRIGLFIDQYNAEVDRYHRKGRPDNVDDFVDYSRVKWSSTLKGRLKRGQIATFNRDRIHTALYRPFQKLCLYYDPVLNDRPGLFRRIFPCASAENKVLVISDIGFRATGFSSLISDAIVDLHLCAAVDAHQCFPFYTYSEDGSNRQENITDWALNQFRDHYQDKSITKWDIFYYVYGLLHHPGYRSKFADNLKRELPRLPFAPDFRAFASAGQKLAALHLDYEALEPCPLEVIETPAVPLSYRVEDKMRLSKDKSRLIVNGSLALAGIPAQTFNYRLGNRSALEWVIDQYQVHTDPRSGIVSDPNRAEDPEYIVRLVGQVVRVSLETVAIVEGLPERYSAASTA